LSAVKKPNALKKLSAVIRISSPSVVPNNMSSSKLQIKQRNPRCTCGELLLHVRIIMETTVPVQKNIERYIGVIDSYKVYVSSNKKRTQSSY